MPNPFGTLTGNHGVKCSCCKQHPADTAPMLTANTVTICTDCVRHAVATHSREVRRRSFGAPEILKGR